jgi:hypothetical protein
VSPGEIFNMPGVKQVPVSAQNLPGPEPGMILTWNVSAKDDGTMATIPRITTDATRM